MMSVTAFSGFERAGYPPLASTPRRPMFKRMKGSPRRIACGEWGNSCSGSGSPFELGPILSRLRIVDASGSGPLMENPHVPRKPIRRRRHCAHESSAECQIKREQEADEEGN